MPGWTTLSDKALDDGFFYQDANEHKYNALALKEFPKEVTLGGDPKRLYTNTAYATIEDAIFREVGGVNVQGATYELHFMGQATSGDTVFVRVWDITNGAQLVEKSFTITALDLVKSASFTLPSTTVKIRVEVKATAGGAGSPFKAYGFSLVQK